MGIHSTSIKSLVSGTRIMFGLLPGMGALILIRMVIHLYRTDIEDTENRITDYSLDQLYDCYDFIIVGAGTAGSILANRLSENEDWNILLLEAGQNENVLSEVPALFPVLQTSAIDWQFETEPSDDYCLSMVGRRCKWPRGKLLGGSSAINAMLYIRGNKRDYDYWASLGNEGWSYDEIFKYFLKAEDMKIPKYQNDPYHATGGPVSIEYFKIEQPITRKILEAGEQLGYRILDVNGESQTGFTKSQATLRDGLRCSTAKAYLRPASKRPNLHISLYSQVEKVLIDENKAVYGVQFTKHGHKRIIKVSKEVILSSGAIQSPQILMLSGIGDAGHLKELGIYPVVHLPGVGKNLQDHVAMGGHSFLFDNPFKNSSDYSFNLNTLASLGTLIDFSINKAGLLYSMMEAEAMAFVNTKYQNPIEDYPDIQFFIAPCADNMDGGLFGKRANGLSDETYAELYEDILFDSSFSIVPLLLRPKSRGYIRLRDANPYSAPLIYPNYYTHPDDIKVMIEGAKIAQALTEQPALAELNTRPNPNRNPGCVKYSIMSDEHLECQARHHTLTLYHPVGTCAMGIPDNEDAVVDPRLKVYGTTKLRVVDGSIMPTIVNGNTNAPIIMIAEKASDMIKEDWAIQDDYPIKCSSHIYNRHTEDIADNITNNLSKEHKFSTPNLPINIFNETADLFPNIPQDGLMSRVKINKDKINVSNSNYNNDIKLTNPYNYYQPMGNYQEDIYTSRKEIINPTVVEPKAGANYFNPYYIPRERIKWPYQQDRRNFLSPIKSKPRRINHIYIPRRENNRDPYVYLRDNESKKCRLWLYYNGLKYELQL